MAPELTRVGPYEILERISQSGMGVLYRAHHPELDREVSLKVVSAERLAAAGEEARARFFRDAAAAAQLQHRNIVTIFERADQDGLAYIVMERLHGQSLATRLKSAPPLSLEEQLDIVTELCSGLEFAHRHGVVHRDIKPSNIWLSEDGTVKLLDFGMASVSPQALSEDPGTLTYMAPEQIRGTPADDRADIFSATVVLYELLAGRGPFDAGSPAETIERVLSDTPPTMEALAPELPASLVTLVKKGLSRNPDERYQTAADLAVELQTIRMALAPDIGALFDPGGVPAADQPTIAPDLQTLVRTPHPDLIGTLGARPRPAPRRENWTRGLVAVIGVVLCVAVGFAWSRSRQLPVTPPAVVPSPTPVVPSPVPSPPSVPVPPPAASFSLRVESTPADAAIRVDGRDTGLRTPALVAFADTASHVIELTKPGFQRAERRPAKAEFDGGAITVKLQPERVAEPVTARLIVSAMAESSYEFEVRDGSSTLSPMSRAHNLTVTVRPDSAIRLVNSRLLLDWPVPKSWMSGRPVFAPPLGRLQVVVPTGSAHQKCLVYFDGHRFGEVGEVRPVPAGLHQVELRCGVQVISGIEVVVTMGEAITVKRIG